MRCFFLFSLRSSFNSSTVRYNKNKDIIVEMHVSKFISYLLLTKPMIKLTYIYCVPHRARSMVLITRTCERELL